MYMSSMYVHGLILVFNKYVHVCLLESNAQGVGGVGVLRILSDGMIKGFFVGGGGWNFRFLDFFELQKFGKYFFGWLHLSRDFFLWGKG